MKKQSQRLDNFSKILLATGQINFFASSLNDLDKSMRQTANKPNGEWVIGRVLDNEKQMESLVKKLSRALENLHDYMNGIDAVSEIDMRISKVPNEILIFQQDEVDESYTEED